MSDTVTLVNIKVGKRTFVIERVRTRQQEYHQTYKVNDQEVSVDQYLKTVRSAVGEAHV